MPLINPKFTVAKLNDFDVASRVMSLSQKERVIGAAGIGASGGIVKSGIDTQDDSAETTAKKAIVGGAIGTGTAIGLEQLMTKTRWGEKFVKSEESSFTASDIAKEDVTPSSVESKKEAVTLKSQAQRIVEEGNVQQPKKDITPSDVAKIEAKNKHDMNIEHAEKVKKMKNWANKSKLVGALGLGVFALASVMDTSDRLDRNRRVSAMKEEQEENLQKKLKRQERSQAQNSYGYVDMGEIVGQLFDSRIGHYKMGNSKFQ
ncbi:hypothetical protein QO179_24870 [Bacillus stercoris]|nr:hypothetical protein [Bacillus stercoris]